ncbi:MULTISPECIES: bifunctional UDP-N-acetylglucosamine diphosphorylase/glucosamine-1-phosphate N-acetyltransferase GlmU [unclassified Afipia]|uniref:bifunctional UDP-N-acetylglucosamine diphosphorylase/glucosamine-1-phosphate N-acetyltransferase GlmU n=1 Tax=unclassified Afipia TaxID=2642050 RepID=UPI00046454A5|nr:MULTISPECIES: bifunctional UDP-N-acetylglucosamine diphosphorylase/glucosamine-1-phosphate N-acetyltransferase GlmU [unclassified Afipia]MAH70055.1 bifunctional UDP-N-acetylglucosamine diphosphorylase/glucosamine-1-phosphate N-acetyltransferase GlmU [Afipia sp.]OUX60948.1 MAG: bifunctional N-acetylglucosamine-1-phosphate uridyltransferase/glucosamine-1-phosphate acetyltransferase [Afipia sp. TMED4]HAP09594.1 bifunctional UDP-N-acetylglucosamine diphosphorylase/glucosamine-1-phosphate N-acetyl
MSGRTTLTIVLAAGEGTRMRSSLPKVLHPIAGQPLIAHVLAAARGGKNDTIAVVVGPDHQAVVDEIKRSRPEAKTFVQRERLGTAHAVLAAREAIAYGADDILIAFGDTPLIDAVTFERLRTALKDGAALAVLGFRAADPTGYGRLLVEGGQLVAIREQADASEAERAVTLCNAGVMAFAGSTALKILDRIGNGNSKGEYYLTDAVTIVRELGLRAAVIETGEDEVRGINTKAQLAEAEQVMQQRLRRAALDAGVTLIAPETVFLSADTTFGKDVIIEPFVVIGPGVAIDDGAVIHSFSNIVGARIGKGASVGPYARLRPGTVLGEGVRVGNFVETKAADLEAGVKVNHLTYIGDTHIGQNANIGAGTITCNYDGFDKHRTEIGAGAFVGSNSSLVAPVKIGAGAFIGSGSVITKDVPDDSLAIERSDQTVREGWAKRFRDMKMLNRKPKSPK